MPKKIHYSPFENYFLSQHPKLSYAELTARFNARFGRDLTLDQVKGKCAREGYNRLNNGRFKIGHKPHPRSYNTKPNSGSFTKGMKSLSRKEVGTIGWRKDYLYIKIADPDEWQMLHHYNWIKAYGEIPDGNFIRFKDGNVHNCEVDNLYMVTQAEHVVLNRRGYKSKNADEAEVYLNMARLHLAKARAKEK